MTPHPNPPQLATQHEDLVRRVLARIRLQDITARPQDPVPSPATLTRQLRAHVLELQTAVASITPEQLHTLTASIDADLRDSLKDRQALDNYDGPDLASTLLVRMGLMSITEAEAHTKPTRRRRLLKTPDHVIRSITDVTNRIHDGTVDAKTARAELYALQTLLVAMKMRPELTPPNNCSLDNCPHNIPRLEANTTPQPDTLLLELEQLMSRTLGVIDDD